MKASEFKEKFDLVSYVKDHFEYTDNGDHVFINCPFHSETTGSCAVSNNGWYCFGACGTGGDSIDFLMKVTDLSFVDIVHGSKYIDQYPIKVVSAKKKKYNAQISTSTFKNYEIRLLRSESKIKYLESRGFNKESIEMAHLGYGVPIDVMGYKFHHPRYVIPHFQNGKIIGVKYRIDPLYKKYEKEKYISHPGTSGVIYNIDMFTQSDKIIYVGSQFDAAVLWYRYQIPSVCPPSENTFKDEWIPLFTNKSILIWLDNDQTGTESSLKVYKKIRGVVKKADIFIWNKNIYSEKDDFTDFLNREGIDAVKRVYNAL